MCAGAAIRYLAERDVTGLDTATIDLVWVWVHTCATRSAGSKGTTREH